MRQVLVLDPSGNSSKNEGSGTTGFAWFDDTGALFAFGDKKAEDYGSTELYWDALVSLVLSAKTIVCESYRLQPSKAMAQSWSSLETPQMIGALRYMAYRYEKPFILQDPSIKPRFADPILVKMGVVEQSGKFYNCMDQRTNLHQRDAIRHGLHYFKYGIAKENKNAKNSVR